MTEHVIAAILYFTAASKLAPIGCERVAIEWGQVVCYDRLLPAGVSIVHPSYIDRIVLNQ